MLLYALSVFSIAAFGLSAAGESTLPVTICKRDSADNSVCLKHAVKEAWPRFVAGLPEFDIPSLDPIFYKYGKLVVNSGEIHAEIFLSNVTAVGLSAAQFSDVRAYFLDDVFRLELDVQIPKIIVKGALKFDGNLSVFRIAGKGHFNLTADDVRGTWDLTGHVVNDTWIVEHVHVAPSVEKLKIYFDELIESKELNDLAVAFVNEYWPPLYRVMLPVASDIWDPWLTGISNSFFSKVSFSKVFP